jgi:hypothetical protein
MTNEKKDQCCDKSKCCDSKTIADFLRHLAEFFDKN